MINNSKNQNSESNEEKFNPFSFVAILLYYPAIAMAIRLGVSSYYIFFDDWSGLSNIFGIIVSIIITIIFLIIALGFVYLMIQLGEIIFKLITNRKSIESKK